MLQSFCCLCCLFFLCLPLFAFVYLPLFLLSKIPHCPHCLVFDRVLSEFTRSTRFPSFLLPLSSYHSSSYHSLPTTLPPTTLPPTTLFLLPLFLLPLSSSYHSLPPTTLFLLPLSSSYCVLSLPPTTPTLYSPHSHSHSVPPTLYHPLHPLHPRSYTPYLSTYPLPHRLLSLLPPSSLFSQLAPPGLYPTPGHTTWAASKPSPPLTLQIHPLDSPTPSTQHSPSSYRKSLCKSCNVFAKTTKKGRLSPYHQYHLLPPLPHSLTLPPLPSPHTLPHTPETTARLYGPLLRRRSNKSDNRGLISADRNNKATLLLTIPRCTSKSYA